jgi:hypothetical protein
MTTPLALLPTTSADTGGAFALAQREIAEAQASYLLAARFPRDEARAFEQIRVAFQRPTLAERASYEFSKGGNAITGPSASAAAAMARAWGNLASGWRECGRGIGANGVPYSDVVAYAEDLQTRRRCTIGFIVEHVIDTRDGARPCRDEREIYELTANLAARRVRACVLQLLPEDVVEGAMEQAAVTIKARADTSPEGVAKMVAAFAELGVTRTMIERRMQRPLASITAGQVLGLRRVFASLRDQVGVVRDFFDADPAPPASMPDASPPPADAKVDPSTGEIVPPAPARAPRARARQATKPERLAAARGAMAQAGDAGAAAQSTGSGDEAQATAALLEAAVHANDPATLDELRGQADALGHDGRRAVLAAIEARAGELAAANESRPG